MHHEEASLLMKTFRCWVHRALRGACAGLQKLLPNPYWEFYCRFFSFSSCSCPSSCLFFRDAFLGQFPQLLIRQLLPPSRSLCTFSHFQVHHSLWPLTGHINSAFCTLRGHDEQNTRLNQAQEKTMHLRDGQQETQEAAVGVTQQAVYSKLF